MTAVRRTPTARAHSGKIVPSWAARHEVGEVFIRVSRCRNARVSLHCSARIAAKRPSKGDMATFDE